MMKGKRDKLLNLYMLNLTQQNKLMTEFQTPDGYFARSGYDWKSKGTLVDYHHTSFWSPTQYGWVRTITNKFITSCPGLSFDIVQKYLTKNNQPYLGTYNNLGKAYNPRRIKNSSQKQIQNLNQYKNNFPHPRSQKASILSSSRQGICKGEFTLTKQEGFQSHPTRETNIYCWHTTMTQTVFMYNL